MTGKKFIDHESRGSRKQVPPRRESSVDIAIRAHRTEEFPDAQGRFHRISLGKGALVGSDTTIERGVPIGNQVILGKRNLVASAIGPYTHTGDDVKITRGVKFATREEGPTSRDIPLVRVGDGTRILPGTIVHPRTIIGRRAFIQASRVGQLSPRERPDQRRETSIGDEVVMQRSLVGHGVTIGRGNHILPDTIIPTGVILPDSDTESLQKINQNYINLLLEEAKDTSDGIQPGELTVRQLADKYGLPTGRIYKAIYRLFVPDEIATRHLSPKRTSQVLDPEQQEIIAKYLRICTT